MRSIHQINPANLLIYSGLSISNPCNCHPIFKNDYLPIRRFIQFVSKIIVAFLMRLWYGVQQGRKKDFCHQNEKL